ncbi:MAG: glutamate-5-semialdehyde dehydrogenase [Actinomycetaceae bacterium]|nr:glutamate-5-semialdehyde dehydrogenase [Actinomycetaceae bacterium]
MTMESITETIRGIARRSQQAAASLRGTSGEERKKVLEAFARQIDGDVAAIVAANAQDYSREEAQGMSAGLLDRLKLDANRVASLADAVREVAALPDPVGITTQGSVRPNGLHVRQVTVPMGVVGMVYEARPGVTVDAIALALMSGNAVITRGGSAAALSNAAIVECAWRALAEVGLPKELVANIDEYGREGVTALLEARGLVDLVIPRGGAGLIQTVVDKAKVPVIETGVGNCHVYIDEQADLGDALEIVLNAKTQRVGVCNAAETLLVHQGIASEFLPGVLGKLDEAGIRIHGCQQTKKIAADGDIPCLEATEEDWATEYLSADLAVRVVQDVEEAVRHISQYSSGHTEAICSLNVRALDFFTSSVDAAAIAVNASTRFTDGGQLGLGAEIGISTQKLHARGPMGLSALTTTKWIIAGNGHTRP